MLYQVGPDEDFTTIQEAIDQAVLDGHDGANPAAVQPLPGRYVEDVSLRAGVVVVGLAGAATEIEGTVTCDLVDQGSIDDTASLISNLTLVPPAGQVALNFTGTVAQTLFAIQCQIITIDTEAIIHDNTGVDGFAPSFLATANCRLEGGGAGPLLRQSAGFLALTLSQMESDPTVAAIELTGGAQQIHLETKLTGRIDAQDGFVFLLRPQVETNGQPAISIGSSAFVLALNAILGSDASPVVAGTGVFAYDQISWQSSGIGVDPALTIAGPMRVQGAETLVLAAAPADWLGAPPVNQQEYNDRVAALLVTLNGGNPIP